MHPSGSIYHWYDSADRVLELPGEPTEVDFETLRKIVARVAAAAIIARNWRENTRHFATLALTAALRNSG